MDRDTAPQARAGIPRLSKLPLSRPSANSSNSHGVEGFKSSQLPRPHVQSFSAAKPLSESSNPTVKTAYGFRGQSVRAKHTTPITETFADPQATSLDTTPPNRKPDLPVTEGDENATKAITIATDKRRPRPSLSERTVETLSRIPPTPSPSRRRSSVATSTSNGSNGSNGMGPPNRPISALRGTRPISPSLMRSPSPSKRAFRPPGKPFSPPKSSSSLASSDSIYTPPRAFLRDRSSRTTKAPGDNKRSISSTLAETKGEVIPTGTKLQPIKVKSMHDLRVSAGKQPKSKASMSAIFTDPPPLPNNGTDESKPTSSLVQSKSPSLLSQQVNRTNAGSQKKTSRISKPSPKSDRNEEQINSNKSSTTLRETIAKARAAKKAAAIQEADGESLANGTSYEDSVPIGDIASNPASLKKKMEGAITSGILNMSALPLREFPNEVLNMYEFNESSNISWSEAVDLVKFIAADNEIQEIPDEAFPDWSEEELLSDPDKSNIFAGLEVLDLHGNQLKAVPVGFRRLGRLQILNLNKNTLDYDSLSPIWNISNLRELRMANNMISGVLPDQHGMLSQLQTLDLSYNQITRIPSSISELKCLQKLFLAGNQLSYLPTDSVLSLPLIELDLSNNKLDASLLGDATFESASLQVLDISGNNLKTMTVTDLVLPSLQTFSVQGNRLETLPSLSTCQNLLILSAAENQMSELPQGFLELQKLRSADLSNNQIKAIDPNLSQMESLTAINLAGNPMRERKYLTMNADDIKADLAKKLAPAHSGDGTTEAKSAVEAVGMNESLDSEASNQYQPKNGILDLSSLGLSTIDTTSINFNAQSSHPIHTIRLSNNNLSALPVKLLAHPAIRNSLVSLDISHNTTFHPTDYLTSDLHLPKLRHLYIVSTGITWLNPLTNHLSAPELMELNISCHRLSGSVPKLRTWFPRLTTLLATDNWFHSLDVEAAQGLEVLDVTNNEIESLPPKIGLLGNHGGKVESGRLRSFECSGNRFRVPRIVILEKGTEAVLRDLRRMIPEQEVPEEWKDAI